MTETNQTPSLDEMKAAIRGKFVKQQEDKFTDIKSMIGAAMSYDPKGDEDQGFLSAFAEGFDEGMEGRMSPELSSVFEYARKDNEDLVSIQWHFVGQEFLGMEAMQMYLILDDQKKIGLTEVVGHDFKVDDDGNYFEAAKLSIPVADMIEIAGAQKVEFSLRCKDYTLEKIISDHDLLAIKGFYNNVFDENFEVEKLYKSRNKVRPVPEESSGSCYIATVAYGDIDHPHVCMLRHFRDDVLVKSAAGRGFVRYYYRFSPRVADALEGHRIVNKVIRGVLTCFLWVTGERYRQ